MEIADLMTLLLLALIVALFWAVIPGLIAGWILREAEKSFALGFVLSVLFGPVGVLAALFVARLERREAGRESAHLSSSTSPQNSRSYYEVPIIGRLHVSTVGALAGVATFACVWVLGGLAFELYRIEINKQAENVNASSHLTLPQPATSSNNVKRPNSVPQATPAESVAVTGQPLATARPTALEDFARHTAHSSQTSINAGQPPSMPEQGNASQNVQTAVKPEHRPAGANVQTAEAQPAAHTPDSKPAMQAREAIISEVTQSLNAKGYRVHAAFSGDAQTATLSLSSAALTKESGNSLLGNGRLRATMRAAGIRIVVLINGQESWTYML